MKIRITKEMVTKIGIFIALLFVTIVLFMPSSHASIGSTAKDMEDEINQGVLDDLDDIFFGGYYDKLVEYEVASDIAASLKILGAAFSILVFLIHFFEDLNKGQDFMEVITRAAINIAIAILVIVYLDNILTIIEGVGEEIFDTINDSISNSSKNVKVSIISGKKGVLNEIADWAAIIFPYMLTKLTGIGVKFAAYSILIETMIRRAFAPLAVADVVEEGLRSPGVRYFKRYLACYIKMTICLLAAFFGRCIIGIACKAGGLAIAFELVAINFTVCGLMFKGGETANDIVGA